MFSVLIADDHEILREGLRSLLERERDIKICAEACDGFEALEMVEKHRPDVLLLDVTMPKLGGLETLERVRSEFPGVKTVLLSVHADAVLVRRALSMGADGYVIKSAGVGEIPAAIRSVARGERYFCAGIERQIAGRDGRGAPTSEERPARLSRREQEVLRLIAAGLTAREIAVELAISAKTVEAHRTSLMRKLGVRKATELVRHAVRQGLVDP